MMAKEYPTEEEWKPDGPDDPRTWMPEAIIPGIASIQPGPRVPQNEKCENCGHEGFYHTHNDHGFSYPRDDSTWCGKGDGCHCREFKLKKPKERMSE